MEKRRDESSASLPFISSIKSSDPGESGLSPPDMLSLNTRPQQNFPNAHTVLEPRPASFKSLKPRPSVSIIKNGGRILGKFIPRTPRRPFDPFSIISSRSKTTPTLSISSLASASLGLGFVDLRHIQLERIQPLSEAIDSTIRGLLPLGRSNLLDPAATLGQERQPIQQLNLSTPALDTILDRSPNQYGHSELSPPASTLSLPPALLDPTGQDLTASIAGHLVTSGVDSGMIPWPKVVPFSSGTGPNAPNSSINGSNFSARPNPIPQHIRPLIRPSIPAGPLSNPMSHNSRRFPVFPPNRSSSNASLITTTTYATAPTGSSPPLSLRSMLRCESPGPLPDIFRRDRVHSFQSSALRESIVADDLYYGAWPPNGFLDPRPTSIKSRSSIYHEPLLPDSPSRKILIIGSSYKENSELKRMFSLETLDGASEDRNQLKTVFKERSYSVHTMFEEGFSRERALAKVAQFLQDAEAGDVRAIVFTGHGLAYQDGTVSLVPPEGSQLSDLISRSEWDENIRDHSRPGVVVFSIMAHCFSGEIMKQEFDRQAWPAPTPITTSTKEDEPIYLTFAASDQAAHESWVTRNPGSQPGGARDHFIHALVSAIKSINVTTGTWDEFFEVFDRYFQRARSCASWQDKQVPPSSPSWRLGNHQSPRFSASGFIRLSVVF